MKLIDKSALVAEIERLREEEYPCDTFEESTGYYNALDEVSSFLNTLEVKEVQEEPVSNDLEEAATDYAHDLVHDDVFETFIDGALWQKERLTDKAVKWLTLHDSYSKPTNVLVEDFRKAMEDRK